MKILRNKTGQKIIAENAKVGELARRLNMGETTVREILKQGKVRKHWRLEEAQRDREPMRIFFQITERGRLYRDRSQGSLFSCFLSCLSSEREASQVSAMMLEKGLEQYTRQKVLQEAARAYWRGLITKRKESGAIY